MTRGSGSAAARSGPVAPRRAPLVARALLFRLLLALLLAAPGPASPAFAVDPARVPVPDPPLEPPTGPLGPGALAGVRSVLEAQAAALRTLDAHAYLGTIAPAGADARGTFWEVAGDPRRRARTHLLDRLPPPGQGRVELADVRPVFAVPGDRGTVDVLARHLVAFRGADGRARLLEVLALERLRPATGGAWEAFEWCRASWEEAARTWPVWLEGSVTLDPTAGTLAATMTYRVYPGFPAEPDDPRTLVELRLAPTLTVTAVRGEDGGLEWTREGESLTVVLPEPAWPAGREGREQPLLAPPLVFTVHYRGKVTPSGRPGRGNLEYLGGEAVYLRPESGWYPRPAGGGAVRGTISVTTPGWWAAAASGRLVAAGPAGGVGESRTLTWGLATPAELYLAAGPYCISEATTARGVRVRTFFYAREAEWASSYLEEAQDILACFSDRFGPYPYPNLTLAEVQQFYYGGLSARSVILLEKSAQADVRTDTEARLLLAHEIAHQWWGEIVPIRREPDWFLWEGLASYSEALYAEERDGRQARDRVLSLQARTYAESARPGWSLRAANVRTHDWQDAYVYEKGSWLFHTLRFLFGDEAFFALLREYADRFAGWPPTAEDFGGLVAEAAPEDDYLRSFVERWVEAGQDIDLALRNVSLRRAEAPGSPYVLVFDLDDVGTGAFPRAVVRVVLADGREHKVVCGAGENVLRLDGRPTVVEADPDRGVLDLSRSNNRYYIALGLFPVSEDALADFASVALAAAFGLALARLRACRRRRAGSVDVSTRGC
ncbi:MAG: hypothetical protein K6U08_04580 [Firmicutes bacterium]|nr:hypothetical protein [Bacillota bacterium]